MNRFGSPIISRRRRLPAIAVVLLWTACALVTAVPLSTSAFALTTIEVVTPNPTGDGFLPVTDFRWLVEEDLTFGIVPGISCVDADVTGCLSTNFHRSYMPAVAKGDSAIPSVELDPLKRYFVSVLPTDGYAIGGAQIAAGASTVRVIVQPEPIPTAQIRIFVFRDDAVLNAAPDLPQELGLEGFKVVVEDGGGRYGMSAGTALQNAFGDPIGTTYVGGDTNNKVLPNGPIVTDVDGYVQLKNMTPAKYGISIVPPADGTCPAGWTGTGKWQQTATIEGTKINDAWVKPNEPPFFVEFGPPGPHVFFGFTQDCQKDDAFTGTATLSGTVRGLHMSRPPDYTFWNGAPFPGCWIGLSDLVGGQVIYSRPCDDTSSFSIPGVPAGSYQLSIFDENLDLVIANQLVDVDEAGNCPTRTDPTRSCALGDVSVFEWFARTEHIVFNDKDQDGFRDCYSPECEGADPRDETGIGDQAINIRWRDGSMYQSSPTDFTGFVPFDQTFPFFSWLIAEVDFLRYKATGATIIVDAGGQVDLNGPNPPTSLADWQCTAPGTDCPLGRGIVNPQPQFCTQADIDGGVVASVDDAGPDGIFYSADDIGVTLCATVGQAIVNPNTGNNYSRTEVGPVLLEAFQSFLGQTQIIEWGKTPYARGENGGVSGIVFYDITRAENDPRFNGGEPWQPGIPRIQVALYQDANRDGTIDDLNGDGCPTLADVDNFPFGNFPGPEDFDYALGPDCERIAAPPPTPEVPATLDYGDAINVVTTDSWDDSQPTGCQGDVFYVCPTGHVGICTAASPGAVATDCFDGLRNFNQVRPGVFDGGYAFTSYYPGGMSSEGATEVEGLPTGGYIVGMGEHRVYNVVKEQDKNVDFGEELNPSTLLLPPVCAGDPNEVPMLLSLFPGDGVETFYGGQTRPLCDRKQVNVRSGQNSAADFFLMTEVPIAGHIMGFILDNLANEFDPNAPNFGEKYSPPFLPVSIQDWTGQELFRTYSDRWGSYNLLIPSTFSAAVPMPSGMGPNMLTACMNHPGPIPDPADPTTLITDPNFNRKYSQYCYTFQYMPGTTTYLDTPVVPVAAFAGPGQDQLDCEYPNHTPVIYSVSGRGNGLTGGGGPYTRLTGQGQDYRGLQIVSAGTWEVPNPDYDIQGPDTRKTITRDFGFGREDGEVWLDYGTPNAYLLDLQTWNNGVINTQNNIPLSMAGTHQLTVIRGDNGVATVTGVTVTIGGFTEDVDVYNLQPGQSIQSAIDLARPGDLILVPPGTYNELVVMWKPVRLQGWGAFSATINAAKSPAEKVLAWRQKVQTLRNAGAWTPLPGQECPVNPGAIDLEPACLFTEEGPGIIVLSRNASPDLLTNPGFGLACPQGAVDTDADGRVDCADADRTRNARIDGLGFTGGDTGGAIFVNGFARWLEISNNRVFGNSGTYAGGIRLGHPTLTVNDTTEYDNSRNNNISMHNNMVIENGGFGGVGGGISINHGSNNYDVTGNWICGNYSAGSGAGVGHNGVNSNGVIAGNTILFNQSFDQGTYPSGGGIFVGGGAALGLAGRDALSPGSGSVVIDANLIQGNLAGSGDGGGIRLFQVNGQDVFDNDGAGTCSTGGEACYANADCAAGTCQGAYAGWYKVRIYNNTIVDNVSGVGGGGMALQDAVFVDLINNTIANNDSTATGGLAFELGSPNESTNQPAGIVSRAHSPELLGAVPPPVPGNVRLSAFSNPWMVNDIILHNRTFKFIVCGPSASPAGPTPAECTGLPPEFLFGLWPQIATTADQAYDDLAVVGTGTPQTLDPRYSILSDTPDNVANYTGRQNSFSSAAVNEVFQSRFWNGRRGETIGMPEPATTLSVQPAFDEGGNFIDVRFGPLRLAGDYHLATTSVAVDGGNAIPATCPNAGLAGRLCSDFDGDSRANQAYDIGSDECPTCSLPAAPADGGAGPAGATDPGTDLNATRQTGHTSGPGRARRGGSPVAGPSPSPEADPVFDPIPGDSPSLGSVGTAKADQRPIAAGSAPIDPLAGTDPGDSLETGGNAAGEAAPLALDEPPFDGQFFGPVACSDLYPTGTDPWGTTFRPGSKCMHLTGGDGFINMADGRRLYIFGFRDVTGLDEATSPSLMEEGTIGAEIPAPTIIMDEGDEFYLHLTNVGMQIRPDLFDPHTVHYHGFPNASSVYDGVPDASISINMGGTLTYYYKVVEPGTYMYHCHVEATEHMQMGMLGNLYVRPAQNKVGCADLSCPVAQLGGNADAAAPRGYTYNDGDGSTAYDVEKEIQITSMDPDFHQLHEDVQPLPFAEMRDKYAMLNGRGYPDTVNPRDRHFGVCAGDLSPNPTSCTTSADCGIGGLCEFGLQNTADTPRYSQRTSSVVRATQGQKILLRLSNLSVTEYITLRMLGIPMKVVGYNARLFRSRDDHDLYYDTDSLTIGGGEAADVILDTTGVAPGTYFLYTTNLNFLANDQEESGGVMTEIVIDPAN